MTAAWSSPLYRPRFKRSNGASETPSPCRSVVRARTPGGAGQSASSHAGVGTLITDNLVDNLGISLDHLPTVYLVTGLCTIVFGPLIGKAADKVGQFKVFLFGTVVTTITVLIYTQLGPVSLPTVIAINAVMFVGIFSRMIPFRALVASIPIVTQRGSFNAISASIQQLSGGIASVVAGLIVTQNVDGKLQHYEVAGYVVVATSLAALVLLWYLQRHADSLNQAVTAV